MLSTLGFSQKKFDTMTFGEKILSGKVRPSDDDTTFAVLDSLLSKNRKNKDFYFKVANKIQQHADGSLGEFFSGIASKYYFDFNSEFISNSEIMTSEDIKNWLNQAAFDIIETEQATKKLPKIKERLDNLIINCKCDDNKKALINKFNIDLYKKIKLGLENP